MTLIVEKTVHVPLDRAAAFELFTARIGEWWPIETHSVSGNSEELAPAKGLAFEPKLGGRVVETLADGSGSHWATVTRWSPPGGFELSWHPGEAADAATRVEVRFVDEAGGTRVELTHDGFEIRGDGAQKLRDGYGNGWTGVLDRLVAGSLLPTA